MLNTKAMIDHLQGQIADMQAAVVSLEKIHLSQSGRKKRGRPPLPKCDHGCGKPVHRGRCKGYKTLYKRRYSRRGVTRA